MTAKNYFPTLNSGYRSLITGSRVVGSSLARFARKAWPFLAGVFVLLLLTYTGTNLFASRALGEELEKVQKSGVPLSISALAPPPVPDAENAALVYQQAFDLLPKQMNQEILGDFLSEDPVKRAKVTDEQVRQFIQPLERAMSLAARAARMPRCHFPVNWDAGAEALFPHYGRIRSLTRLFAARAILESKSGDSASAVEDLRSILGMARHINPEPVLIGQLVTYACLNIGIHGLNRVMNSGSLDLQQKEALIQELGQFNIDASYIHCIEGERAFGVWAFDAIHKNPAVLLNLSGDESGNPPLETFMNLGSVAAGPLLKLDEAYYLHSMGRALDALEHGQTIVFDNMESIPKYAVVTKLVLPALERSYQKRDEAEARIGLAKWALALSDYRQSQGDYPAQLSQMPSSEAAALPNDPFTGKPFVYRREGSGFLLYSVGVNHKDEGGRWQTDPRREGDPRTTFPPGSRADDLSWRQS